MRLKALLSDPPTHAPYRKQCAPGKGKQCGKATLSGPASQDYGEQIPNGTTVSKSIEFLPSVSNYLLKAGNYPLLLFCTRNVYWATGPYIE